eukprot:symbB.v1.2.035363.t1/scaffold4743.1/size35524/1
MQAQACDCDCLLPMIRIRVFADKEIQGLHIKQLRSAVSAPTILAASLRKLQNAQGYYIHRWGFALRTDTPDT